MGILLRSIVLIACGSLALGACSGASTSPSSDGKTHVAVHIAPWLLGAHGSGRAIVIVSRTPGHVLQYDPLRSSSVAIYSQDVSSAGPGSTIPFGDAGNYFPQAPSRLAAGKYYVMALMDWGGSYAYSGVGPGMDLSAVSQVSISPGTQLTITLTRPAFGHGYPYEQSIRAVDIPSPELSRFWKKSVNIRAVVVLPPGYERDKQRYPVVYVIHAFRATAESTAFNRSAVDARQILSDMRIGAIPKMIYVYPDAHSQLGHTEFANSVNNGPWATAFADDVVPYMERTYRALDDAQFLTGHSSGAWSALWLQVQYPRLFAGAWAVSPDPVDFRSFLGVNIYAPNANLYERDGRSTAYERAHGHVLMTTREAADLESVEGRTGGQLASFEAVFSPRGSNGYPEPLFNRRTGQIYPRVAAAWKAYDLSELLAKSSPSLRRELEGKLHIVVGTDDTFFLNEPAALFDVRLRSLGEAEPIEFVRGRNHFNIYAGDVVQRIAQQMQHARS